ncbi:MAG: Zn-dependent oxidoreductase, partial [Chitinophagaceae bacterium]
RGLITREKFLGVLVYKVSPADNLELAAKVRPVIDSTFPLENGAQALRRLGSGLAVGKVIISP